MLGGDAIFEKRCRVRMGVGSRVEVESEELRAKFGGVMKMGNR